MSTVTSFGAPWADPARACAVLRAQAAHVVDLSPVEPVDAAAAVVGAHLWVAVTGIEQLTGAYATTSGGSQVAGCILARAAGGGVPVQEVEVEEVPALPRSVLAAFGAAATWVAGLDLPGAGRARALQRAATDLAGGGDGPFSALAAALTLESHQYQDLDAEAVDG